MVDLPPGSLQGMRHPAIAIPWKVENESLDGITQGYRFFQPRWREERGSSVILPGTIDLKQL